MNNLKPVRKWEWRNSGGRDFDRQPTEDFNGSRPVRLYLGRPEKGTKWIKHMSANGGWQLTFEVRGGARKRGVRLDCGARPP